MKCVTGVVTLMIAALLTGPAMADSHQEPRKANPAAELGRATAAEAKASGEAMKQAGQDTATEAKAGAKAKGKAMQQAGQDKTAESKAKAKGKSEEAKAKAKAQQKKTENEAANAAKKASKSVDDAIDTLGGTTP